MKPLKPAYLKTNPRDLVETLRGNRDDAIKLACNVGATRARELLEKAEKDLVYRLTMTDGLTGGAGMNTFTREQMELSLRTIRQSLVTLKGGLKSLVLNQGEQATEQATEHAIDYLNEASQAFGGINELPNIRTVAVLDFAKKGVTSSLLRRLSTPPSGERKAFGILDRYGEAVISKFEEQLQIGLLTKKPWNDIRNAFIQESPFLQGAPNYWAERIVRTETMGAYNRANWEVMRGVNEDLGDMCKILCATFDNRTGADSYAVHGQIRRNDEAFETWQGYVQHPPARPNDREIVVPHRISWPIPPALEWRNDAEILARWRALGNKRPPPKRPVMTTVDVKLFGKT